MSNQLEKIKELIERRSVARIGGGEKAITKQHEKGKYTASKKWICSLNIDVPTSAWRKNIILAMV